MPEDNAEEKQGLDTAENETTETEQVSRQGFVRRHPIWTLLLVLVGAPLVALIGEWTLLRLTTETAIINELHAMSLPASGAELNTWKHPTDSGTKELQEALAQLEALQKKTGAEKFEQLTQTLKPAEFVAHQKELEAFFRDVAPIREKMAQAAAHPDITFDLSYDKGPATSFGPGVMHFRIYALVLAQEARYLATVKQSPDAALQLLTAGFDLNKRMRAYSLIEHLVVVACNAILTKTASQLLDTKAPTAPALRTLAAQLLAPTTTERADERLTWAFAGELAFLQDTFHQLQAPDAQTRKLLAAEQSQLSWYLWPLLRDLDHRACYEEFKPYYLLSRKPFSEAADALDNLRKQKEQEKTKLSLSNYFFAYHFSDALGIQYYRLFQSHNGALAQMLQLGAACTLAADRLEGKDWPASLANDSRLQPDPFTAQPFSLLKTDEAILLVSPGFDRKDSGLAKQYNQTGTMPNPPFDANGQFTGPNPYEQADDVVFRLPRAPFDAAKGSK